MTTSGGGSRVVIHQSYGIYASCSTNQRIRHSHRSTIVRLWRVSIGNRSCVSIGLPSSPPATAARTTPCGCQHGSHRTCVWLYLPTGTDQVEAELQLILN